MARATLLALFAVVAAACSGSNSDLKIESPGLESRATVSLEAARRTALEQVPGGEVEAVELEEEDGLLVYSFDIESDEEQIVEVLIDARTGGVVSRTIETEEQEAAEAADDEGDETDE